MVVDAVEEADRPVPGVAEQVRDLLLDQVLDDEVTATDLGHLLSPFESSRDPWRVARQL
jgi:hypothetical protein